MSDSPCVRNCCLDPHNCCLGCGRLLDEIIEWHSATAQRRQQILQLATVRLDELKQLATARRRAANLSE